MEKAPRRTRAAVRVASGVIVLAVVALVTTALMHAHTRRHVLVFNVEQTERLRAAKTMPPQPRGASPLQNVAGISVMTYNIRHGAGMDLVVDLNRTAAVITASGADVVLLQEVDVNTQRAPYDEPAVLAEATGLRYHAFVEALAFQGGSYGNAVLSRWPILETQTMLYSAQTEETRGLVGVRVRHPRLSSDSWFVSTHLSYCPNSSNDPACVNDAMFTQVQELEAWVSELGSNNVVFGGDFNCIPRTAVPEYLTLRGYTSLWDARGEGPGLGFPADAPDRRIDFLWTTPSSLWTAKHIEIVESEASDHRPMASIIATYGGHM